MLCQELKHDCGMKCTLQDFQKLADWVNWSFNMYSLLKPALVLIYTKMAGKSKQLAQIYISHTLIQNLTWLEDYIKCSDSILLMKPINWVADEADLVAYCNTLLMEMSIFISDLYISLQSNVPYTSPKDTIFFYGVCHLSAATLGQLSKQNIDPL